MDTTTISEITDSLRITWLAGIVLKSHMRVANGMVERVSPEAVADFTMRVCAAIDVAKENAARQSRQEAIWAERERLKEEEFKRNNRPQ